MKTRGIPLSSLPPRLQAQVVAQLHPKYAAPIRPLSNPKPEHHKAPALGGSVQGKEGGLPRTTVRFIGYRVRPLDPDNFAGSCKDLLDGLRHAGLISGDEAWRIRFQTEQVRVGTFAEEVTVIEIE
jgi:hypothetical protein